MTDSPRRRRRLIARIQSELDRASKPDKREWWTAYLKGEAAFRGVPIPCIRKAIWELWDDELATRPRDEAKRLAVDLMAEEPTEDKLAGVLLLAEPLLDSLGATDLGMLAEPFECGAVRDWNVTDRFAINVLARLCARDEAPFADALAAWLEAASLWQRRCVPVSLTTLAPHSRSRYPWVPDRAIAACETLVADPARFSQTAVGWLLRELSKAEPSLVESWVGANETRLSREARRMATAKLEGRRGR